MLTKFFFQSNHFYTSISFRFSRRSAFTSITFNALKALSNVSKFLYIFAPYLTYATVLPSRGRNKGAYHTGMREDAKGASYRVK